MGGVLFPWEDEERFDDVELVAFDLLPAPVVVPELLPLPVPLLEDLFADFVEDWMMGASAQYTMCVLMCSQGKVYVVWWHIFGTVTSQVMFSTPGSLGCPVL